MDLNNLIDPDSGWFLEEATDINEDGWIVGVGINPNDEAHAFLLNPIPIPGAVITVTSPNGGEELFAGTVYEITWSSDDGIESVKIEYSVNNGADWMEIAINTENDGSFLWEVPYNSSDECLVKISDVDGDPLDVSDGVFAINIPLCKGDFNDDGYVDESDLSIFAFAFGTTDCNWRPPYCYWWPILCNWWPPTCECDFDGDDDVDGSDNTVFAADFGRTDCP